MKTQIILGIVFIVLGIILSLTFIGAIYGIPMLLIGVALIIFRNEENKIEKINQKGRK